MSGAGESGADQERDLLAGEFVLGTLGLSQMQHIEKQAREDAELAGKIAEWQARLSPLSRLAAPVPPPPTVWSRIAESAGLPPALQTVAAPAWHAFWRNLTLWRWTTAASLAAAIALLVVVLLRPPVMPRQVAVLLSPGGKGPAFLAEETSGGGLRLHAVAPVAVAAGKDLELWALPPSASRPVALGVIPAVAQQLVLPHPRVRLTARTQLMVSLEPKGGSPTGQPTGPVLFAGTLAE